MADGFTANDIKDGKMYALLSYLSLCCIIPLILKKNNPFVLHHAKQALVLFVGQVALFILSILLPGWLIKTTLFIDFSFAFWGMICALRGLSVELPVVCRIAAKIQL